MRKLTLICGLLACMSSYGADWVFVSSDTTGSMFYVDYDFYNYNKTENTVEIWYKINEKSNGKIYTSQKTLTKYACKGKKHKDISSVTYFSSGAVKYTHEYTSTMPYKTVFPDTVGEALFDVACDTLGKGLDFKYPNLNDFENYMEYERAQYAYLRLKQKEDNYLHNLTPNLKIEHYSRYDEYLKDVKKELDIMRKQNIEKQHK